MDPDRFAEIKVVSEYDFVDLEFTLVDRQRDADGVQRLVAKGSYDGRTVGFGVTLGPKWERQDVEDAQIWLYWGEAELTTLGDVSDGFVQALDELYGTDIGTLKMCDRVPFIAVSLAGYPPLLNEESVKLKLFFESDAEEKDAEFFLNIDLRSRSVQFHEKDTDYRRGVVLSLSCSD